MKCKKSLLIAGRHVATFTNDELLAFARSPLTALRDMAELELARRPTAKERTTKKGYTHFGSGQRGTPNSLNAYNTKPKRDDKRSER